MKFAIATISALALLAGCASSGTNQVQADLPVDKGSVSAGAGSSVTIKGGEMPLSGWGFVEVGEPLPEAVLANTSLQPVSITDNGGKVRIISVVPSLDTPTCDRQTHELSEENGGLDESVELITVSMDLPFAQTRFAKEAKINNVTFLSDYKNREFGNSNGLIIEPLGLLARAVIVTDQDNIVRHLQVVPEVTALPDMQAAMQVARSLL
jgi:thiol peroxidase